MTTPIPPQIPFELYRPIIEYVADSYDSYLARTCILLRVCRTWRTETERIMYTKVNVPHSRLLFFCKAIISRPALGALIRRLEFTAAGHRPKQPGDTELVAQMLKLLPNLTDLAISEGPFDKNVFRTADWVVGKNDYWVLDNVPFILERYRCHFSWGQGLVDFLSTQPYLREFIHVGGAPPNADSVPEMSTKNTQLETLHVPPHTLWGMKAPYPLITHLLVKIWDLSVVDAYAAARSIAPLGGSLRCLCLSRLAGPVVDEFPSISSMVKLFAPSAPHLRYLAIYDEVDFSRGENKRLKDVIGKYLHKLEVIVWAPLWDSRNEDEDFDTTDSGFSIDTDDDEESFDKTQRYAQAMMSACSSLKLFISLRRCESRAWIRDSATGKARFDKRVNGVSDDCFRYIDPDAPLDYFLSYTVRDRSKRRVIVE